MEKCAGVTLTGKKCKKFVIPGDRFCYLHSKKSPKRSSPKRRISSPKKSPSPKRRISSPKKSPSKVFQLDETLLPMLLDMKPDDLKRMCSVDRRINRMCSNPEFRRLYRLRWPKLGFMEDISFVRNRDASITSVDGPTYIAITYFAKGEININFVEKMVHLWVLAGELQHIEIFKDRGIRERPGPSHWALVPKSQEEYDKSPKWVKNVLSNIGLTYLVKYGDKQIDYVMDGVKKLFEISPKKDY